MAGFTRNIETVQEASVPVVQNMESTINLLYIIWAWVFISAVLVLLIVANIVKKELVKREIQIWFWKSFWIVFGAGLLTAFFNMWLEKIFPALSDAIGWVLSIIFNFYALFFAFKYFLKMEWKPANQVATKAVIFSIVLWIISTLVLFGLFMLLK